VTSVETASAHDQELGVKTGESLLTPAERDGSAGTKPVLLHERGLFVVTLEDDLLGLRMAVSEGSSSPLSNSALYV